MIDMKKRPVITKHRFAVRFEDETFKYLTQCLSNKLRYLRVDLGICILLKWIKVLKVNLSVS